MPNPGFSRGSGIVLTLFFLIGCATIAPITSAPESGGVVGPVLPESAYALELALARTAMAHRPANRDTYATGLSHALRAVQLEPDSIDAVLTVSDLNLKLSRMRDAINGMETAYLAGIPRHELLPERIAWLYSRAGAFTRAVDWYETALSHHPRDPNLHSGYVNALIRDKRFAEAREWVENPVMRSLLTLHMAATVLEQNPELDLRTMIAEAWAGLRSATETERIDAAMLLSNLAVLYAGEDEAIPRHFYSQAVRLIEPLSTGSADPEPVWSLLADLYEQLGDDAKSQAMRRLLRDRLAY